MKIHLFIFHKQEVGFPKEKIAYLLHENDETKFICGTEKMRKSFENNLKDGLSEWISSNGEISKGIESQYRFTPIKDELFLARLKDYYQRQFDFEYILKVE